MLGVAGGKYHEPNAGRARCPHHEARSQTETSLLVCPWAHSRRSAGEVDQGSRPKMKDKKVFNSILFLFFQKWTRPCRNQSPCQHFASFCRNRARVWWRVVSAHRSGQACRVYMTAGRMMSRNRCRVHFRGACIEPSCLTMRAGCSCVSETIFSGRTVCQDRRPGSLARPACGQLPARGDQPSRWSWGKFAGVYFLVEWPEDVLSAMQSATGCKKTARYVGSTLRPGFSRTLPRSTSGGSWRTSSSAARMAREQ